MMSDIVIWVILVYEGKKIEILSTPSNLEIRVTNGDRASCVAVRKLLQNEIESIINTTPHMSDVVNTAFYCTRSLDNRPDIKPHLVEYPHKPLQQSIVNPLAVTWCNTCKETMCLEEKHKIWFEVFNYYSYNDYKLYYNFISGH